MRRMHWVMAALLLSFGSAYAATVTVTDQNSSLKYTTDDPGSNLGQPSDPVQLPRKVEWTVDGRRILVYPSGTSSMLDISHLHSGAHVNANQMHAQGPLLGFAIDGSRGTVLGGVVYSVHGGAADSGVSRMSEKVDIHNKTNAAVSISLTGLGFKSPQASLEVPDFSGLNVTGTTVAFFQGNAQTNSFTEPPTFPPVTVLPVVSFSGFNPLLNQPFSLPAGAHLTMITELKVERAPLLVAVWVWILLALALAVPAGVWLVKRRDAGK